MKGGKKSTSIHLFSLTCTHSLSLSSIFCILILYPSFVFIYYSLLSIYLQDAIIFKHFQILLYIIEKSPEAERFKKLKAWHTKILRSRAEFLTANRDELLPFSSEASFDRIVNKANRLNVADSNEDNDEVVLESLRRQENPDYIVNGILRNYQFEGDLHRNSKVQYTTIHSS